MKNIKRSLQQRASSTGPGQIMIEFALVLPVIVLLLLGTMDLARAVYAYGVISNAARDGAHWGSLRPTLPITVDTTDTDHGDMNIEAIKVKALSNTKTLDQGSIEADPQCFKNDANPYMAAYSEIQKEIHKCDSWNWLTVIVKYKFQPITMFFSKFELQAESTMTIE